MDFLDSLSRWFKGGSPAASSESRDADHRRSNAPDTPGATDIAIGKELLMMVAGRNFLVTVTDMSEDSLRVTFPGIDYPVNGMQVELEIHETDGFAYYLTTVKQGPRKDGDGVVLDIPAPPRRSMHRDTFRVPTNLEGEVLAPGSDRWIKASVTNVSAGGAYIEMKEESYTEGTTVDLALMLPGDSRRIVQAQILHAVDPREKDGEYFYAYGTRFTGYEPGAGREITQYIEQLLRDMYPSA
jgi:hypothetical protein